MRELNSSEYARVDPVLADLNHCLPMRGVITRDHPGRIFVDDKQTPTVALVWTPWGYYYLGGNADNTHVHQELHVLLTQSLIPNSVAAGEGGLLLTPDSADAWAIPFEAILPNLVNSHMIEIYRRIFDFHPAAFEPCRQWRRNVPDDFEMRRIDAELAQWMADQLLMTWRSLEEFLARGLGFCLLHDGEVVSTCTSAFVVEGKVEIGVQTAEAYQRRGFGMLTASALIDACLEQDLTPNWECFWDNTSSIKLAERLGFEAREDYPVFYLDVAHAH